MYNIITLTRCSDTPPYITTKKIQVKILIHCDGHLQLIILYNIRTVGNAAFYLKLIC